MSTAEMNSMNHCALGAIGRFLFEDVAGIDATTTAWSGVVRVAPQYTRSLEWARASYASPSGLVTTRWQWEGDSIVQEVTVPPGITAEVHVPEGFSCDSATELGPGAHFLVLRGAA
jgi:alpha-L-rhamnosidase